MNNSPSLAIADFALEGSIESDFLLIILKKLLQERTDLKVILMSATVDAERFSNYLDGAPVLYVPGRTFPVETKYLEDALELTGYSNRDRTSGKYLSDEFDNEDAHPGEPQKIPGDLSRYRIKTIKTLEEFNEYRIPFELILQLLKKIATDASYREYSRAILVFLPGITEIWRLHNLITGEEQFRERWNIHPLHSAIATEEQERAFVIPPAGVRKIVLATNIAETGITIPDVTCVIDAGKHKEMR